MIFELRKDQPENKHGVSTNVAVSWQESIFGDCFARPVRPFEQVLATGYHGTASAMRTKTLFKQDHFIEEEEKPEIKPGCSARPANCGIGSLRFASVSVGFWRLPKYFRLILMSSSGLLFVCWCSERCDGSAGVLLPRSLEPF